MRQNQGQIPLFKGQKAEQQHKRYTHDGIRGRHGDIVDGQIHTACTAAHLLNADGSRGTQDGSKDGRDDRDEDGHIERMQDALILKHLYIPIERKAMPGDAALAVVEREQHEHEDRCVQQDEQDGHVKLLNELFHHSISPPSSEEPSSNLFITHMHRKMSPIITSAMAEPSCGL